MAPAARRSLAVAGKSERRRRRFVAGAILLLSACSGGGGGSSSFVLPGDFHVVAATPAPGAWVGPEVTPEVVFSKPIGLHSVDAGDVAIQKRGGARVAAAVHAEGMRLRLVPHQPLAEGHYELVYTLQVEAADGSVLSGPAVAPRTFSVRPVAGAWSDPVTLGAAAAVDEPFVVASDLIGGASVAWLHEGQVMVAEYDRDGGWFGGVVADRPTGIADAELLLARGAGTVAVATVAPGGYLGETFVRVRVSRSFTASGARQWEPAVGLVASAEVPPQIHVDAAGRVFLLVATEYAGRSYLRVLWLDAGGSMRDELLSRAAGTITIDRVFLGVRGDVAIAWTETSGAARAHYVRIHRASGFDSALALSAPPMRGGFSPEGDAWLLLPDGSTRSVYLTQHAERWGSRGTVPASLDQLVARNLDLLQLDWRFDGGAETLLARRYDRLGNLLAEDILVPPAVEPVRHVLLAGDLESEVRAIWLQGERTRWAQLRREPMGGLAWSRAEDWAEDHRPVPVTAALATPAGARTALTWVEDGHLVATFLTPRLLVPRPARNPRQSASAAPLAEERFAGSTFGALLVVWREDGNLRAQALR